MIPLYEGSLSVRRVGHESHHLRVLTAGKRPEFQTFRQNISLDVEGAKKNTNSNISEAESTRLVEHDKHIFILTNKRSTEWEKDILRKVRLYV